MSGETSYPMEHPSDRITRAMLPRLGRDTDVRQLFAGMGRERASRTGAALVERAAETGEWFPLVEALCELRAIIVRHDDRAASDYAAVEHRDRGRSLGEGPWFSPEYMGNG